MRLLILLMLLSSGCFGQTVVTLNLGGGSGGGGVSADTATFVIPKSVTSRIPSSKYFDNAAYYYTALPETDTTNKYLAITASGRAVVANKTTLDTSTILATKAWYNNQSGEYTPTVTNIANIESTTVGLTMWRKEGDYVEVWGTITIDPTAATTITDIDLSLPPLYASNFTTTDQLTGTGQGQLENLFSVLEANTTNDRARLRTYAVDTDPYVIRYSYRYKIL